MACRLWIKLRFKVVLKKIFGGFCIYPPLKIQGFPSPTPLVRRFQGMSVVCRGKVLSLSAC